jgi:hypothetical protein
MPIVNRSEMTKNSITILEPILVGYEEKIEDYQRLIRLDHCMIIYLRENFEIHSLLS